MTNGSRVNCVNGWMKNTIRVVRIKSYCERSLTRTTLGTIADAANLQYRGLFIHSARNVNVFNGVGKKACWVHWQKVTSHSQTEISQLTALQIIVVIHTVAVAVIKTSSEARFTPFLLHLWIILWNDRSITDIVWFTKWLPEMSRWQAAHHWIKRKIPFLISSVFGTHDRLKFGWTM